jgi:putative membrane protein
MLARWLLAAFHLLALGLGLGAIWVRHRAFRGPLDQGGLRRLFGADTLWGVAALLWIGTGLARAFGGFEKGTAYYVANTFFRAKMGFLIIILLLEIWPMITLIKWRARAGRRQSIDTSPAVALSRISAVQAALIVAMVFAATGMARGWGAGLGR